MNRWLDRIFSSVRLVGVVVLTLVACPQADAQRPSDSAPTDLSQTVAKLDLELDQSIRPWLKQHCLDCHEGAGAEGNLDLSKPFKVKHVVGSVDKWRRLWQRVEAGEMPPPDHEVLSGEQQQVFGHWLEQVLFDVACQTTVPRRSPAARRLTRAEYRLAVEDLTGVRYPATDQFPADEVGHGFDNITELLMVSPLLMEKYLSAAEAIAAEAIIDPAGYRLERTLNGSELSGGEGTFLAEQDQVIASGGELTAEISVPKQGKYKIELTAWGQQAGDEVCRMGIIVDGKQVEEFEVSATRRRPSTHAHEIEISAGNHKFGVSFNNDYYNPDDPDINQRDRNLGIKSLKVTGPEGEVIPSGPKQAELVFLRPDDMTRPAAAARNVLEKMTAAAYRRKAEPAEVLRLVKLFDEQMRWGASYDSALQTCLVAILTSPSFLFKFEKIPAAGEVAQLRPRELAQNLAFLFWSRGADAELLDLAQSGQLTQRTELRSQVVRLLNDDRSQAWLDNFVEQWLYLRTLNSMEPQPELSAELVASMQEETKTFVANLVRENRPVRELVEADYTFVNKPLAAWYGLQGEFAPDKLSRVSLTGSARRGLLGQASVLRLTSNPDRTSPVKRGKWILETLLNQPPPPPAPDVPQLDSQSQLTGTLRQKMEQHRRDPNCASCHLRMDALGFALERYDELGRWRDLADGQPIDDRGELPGGIEVAGASKLGEVLSNQYERQMARCFVEKLMTFALGRGLTLHDDACVSKILEETRANGYRLGDLVQAVVASDSFQQRSGGPKVLAGDESKTSRPQEN